MTTSIHPSVRLGPVHDWLHKIAIAYTPGSGTPLVEQFAADLLDCFRLNEHTVYDAPKNPLDVLLTTAKFGEPLGWRKAVLAHARRRYKLDHTPTVFTLLHVTPAQLDATLAHLQKAVEKDIPDPADFNFPGLEANAYLTLYEQGKRGGVMMALERMVQAQAMSIRNILVVGEDAPLEAYTFDLVGAHPRTSAADRMTFYEDLMLRIVTAVSTEEITNHEIAGQPVDSAVWRSLNSPKEMQEGGRQLGLRNFFTEMVNVANLVNIPYVPDTVATQYSEGCFATWEPRLDALVTTVTGSARPVHKYDLKEDDLALIVGVRPDRKGALVRHVSGKRNDPPSSEAVELMLLDAGVPRIRLGASWGYEPPLEAPASRSKLHGHRGVHSFNPTRVEPVPLALPYYHYPVSCATQAQAESTQQAFSRSAALNDPADPRQVVFTVLPGHGVMIAEKWVPGKVPFQVIWEAMDAGDLEIDRQVPQGVVEYRQDKSGRMVLVER